MRKIMFFLIVFYNVQLQAQTAKDVLEAYSQEFSKPRYMQYTSKYMLYKGYNTKEILESYSGEFKKNKTNDVYIKAQSNELITNKNMSITISHKEKAIFVESPKKHSSGPFDINELLPYFKLAPLETINGKYLVKLLSTPTSGMPYSTIEIYFNKKYEVIEQVFYFSTAYNLSDDYEKPNYIYPKLVIQNTNFQYNPISESFFTSESYITISGKTIASKKKDYKIYDKRQKPIK